MTKCPECLCINPGPNHQCFGLMKELVKYHKSKENSDVVEARPISMKEFLGLDKEPDIRIISRTESMEENGVIEQIENPIEKEITMEERAKILSEGFVKDDRFTYEVVPHASDCDCEGCEAYRDHQM